MLLLGTVGCIWSALVRSVMREGQIKHVWLLCSSPPPPPPCPSPPSGMPLQWGFITHLIKPLQMVDVINADQKLPPRWDDSHQLKSSNSWRNILGHPLPNSLWICYAATQLTAEIIYIVTELIFIMFSLLSEEEINPGIYLHTSREW